MYKETWHDRARRRMRALKKRQEDLAGAMGVQSRAAVGHYLTGRRQPSIDQAIRLARALECSLDWLFLGDAPRASAGASKPAGRRRATGGSGSEMNRGAHGERRDDNSGEQKRRKVGVTRRLRQSGARGRG